MKRTGIFGGTFNPVHNGHLRLAGWIVDNGVFDEVWLTLSPANPLKDDRPGATDADRQRMLVLACKDKKGLQPNFVEFDMPRPSYSISTLRKLAADYPERRFGLIIGSDNWQIFNRWRAHDEIIRDFGVTIYPRPGYEVGARPLPDGVSYLADAPVTDASSTDIRAALRSGDSTLLPPAVADYITAHNLYEHAR